MAERNSEATRRPRFVTSAVTILLPAADAPAGQVPFTDATIQEDAQFDAAFPYLRTPRAGAGM